MIGPIEEVSEAQADERVGAVYAEIKRASGTPLINLIYRHLATMPDVLEWAWGNISRDGGYGRLETASARLPRHRLCCVLPREAWHLTGLADSDIAAMARLVDNYNKTNAINLIAVTCLRQAISARHDDEVPANPGVSGSALASADSRQSVEIVRQFLNELVSGQPHIEPTMFRNFLRWPASLAMTSAILAPLVTTGMLASARMASIEAARQIAGDLAASGPPLEPLSDPDTAPRVWAALTLFQRDIIGSMLPVGHGLADALGGASA